MNTIQYTLMAISDHIGETFGRFTVIAKATPLLAPSGRQHYKVKCECDCGQVVEILWENVKSGKSRSCGCLRKDKSTTHGWSKTRTYKIWEKVVSRGIGTACRKHYADRGIVISDSWRSFENFVADMGECPDGLSIDRINNDKGYFKGNCRWASARVQSRNKSNTVNYTYRGKTQCLVDHASDHGINLSTLRYRLRLGWTLHKALTTPLLRKI